MEERMIGLAIKAFGVGFVLYGLALSAKNGLNKATVRKRHRAADAQQNEPTIADV